MSMFDQEEYRWRETYFILFDARNRPRTAEVAELLKTLPGGFEVANLGGNQEEMFESVTLLSAQDYAAMEISFIEGDDVQEHIASIVEEMKQTSADPDERQRIDQLLSCNARLDVMHFQQVVEADAEGEGDEMFDPSALLIVLEALTEQVKGESIDPQSGSFL